MKDSNAVIPSAVEGSRGEIFKATQRGPSTCARDDRLLLAIRHCFGFRVSDFVIPL
jgi:hypothetical protein